MHLNSLDIPFWLCCCRQLQVHLFRFSQCCSPPSPVSLHPKLEIEIVLPSQIPNPRPRLGWLKACRTRLLHTVRSNHRHCWRKTPWSSGRKALHRAALHRHSFPLHILPRHKPRPLATPSRPGYQKKRDAAKCSTWSSNYKHNCDRKRETTTSSSQVILDDLITISVHQRASYPSPEIHQFSTSNYTCPSRIHRTRFVLRWKGIQEIDGCRELISGRRTEIARPPTGSQLRSIDLRSLTLGARGVKSNYTQRFWIGHFRSPSLASISETWIRTQDSRFEIPVPVAHPMCLPRRHIGTVK